MLKIGYLRSAAHLKLGRWQFTDIQPKHVNPEEAITTAENNYFNY